MEANLGLKKSMFGGQAGLHVGRVLAPLAPPKIGFLRPHLASCWPHVNRQLEPMLESQHGPMLGPVLDPFGSSKILQKWILFGSQLGSQIMNLLDVFSMIFECFSIVVFNESYLNFD